MAKKMEEVLKLISENKIQEAIETIDDKSIKSLFCQKFVLISDVFKKKVIDFHEFKMETQALCRQILYYYDQGK
jgi:phosphoribosylaminoimidazole-succinocarboxamide synthase